MSTDSILRWKEHRSTGEHNVAFPRYLVAPSTCRVGHKIYTFGGYGANSSHISQNNIVTSVFCLDLQEKKWSRPLIQGERPGMLTGYSFVLIDDEIHIFGDGQIIGRYIRKLDVASLRWMKITIYGDDRCDVPLNSAQFMKETSSVLIFGGKRSLNDFWYVGSNSVTAYFPYKYISMKLSPKGMLPLARHSAGAFVNGNRFFIVGGTHSSFGFLQDIHILTYEGGTHASWSRYEIKNEIPMLLGPCICFPYNRNATIQVIVSRANFTTFFLNLNNSSWFMSSAVEGTHPSLSYFAIQPFKQRSFLIIGGYSLEMMKLFELELV